MLRPVSSPKVLRVYLTLAMAWAGTGLAQPTPEFRVQLGPNAETLSVEATFPSGTSGTLVLEDGGERFVQEVQLQQAGHWVEAVLKDGSVVLPACQTACRLRYRFLLREAARALKDPQAAAEVSGGFVSPPSLWLLHPAQNPLPGYRLSFSSAEGTQALCGLAPAGEQGAYRSTAGLRVTPLCAFGRWRVRTVAVGGARVTLAIAPVSFVMRDEEMGRWVAEATAAVAAYYHRFPVDDLLLLVVPNGGRGLSGFTLGEGGASILLRLGLGVPAERARSDWVLTHELMHLGFPTLSRKHSWMEEGMAVFGEPIVRVRARMVDQGLMWSEWLEQGRLGLPGPGEGGLETTHTWARTYWGGGVFWLVADVTLRERTQNRRSVDDVLRALVAAGGNVTSHWEIGDVLKVADETTGLPVFSELYHQLGEQPGAPDLDALLRRLGVSQRDGKVVYDDAAPLASVRRAMVATTPR